MDNTYCIANDPVPTTELVKRCLDAMTYAYCPYSNFPVGAALLCQDGTIYTGCNVENASYSLTNCAEKTVICKAVSEGQKKFTAIAVCTTLKDSYVSPCGSCRQVIAEFGPDMEVIMVKPDSSYKCTRMSALLPLGFTSDQLVTAQTQNGHVTPKNGLTPDQHVTSEIPIAQNGIVQNGNHVINVS